MDDVIKYGPIVQVTQEIWEDSRRDRPPFKKWTEWDQAELEAREANWLW